MNQKMGHKRKRREFSMRDSLESRTGSEEDGDQLLMVDKTKNKCDSSWGLL